LTYNLAVAAAMDAGNKNMRKHGRRAWSEEDRDIASDMLRRLLSGGSSSEAES
jgi:hypothetical protein